MPEILIEAMDIQVTLGGRRVLDIDQLRIYDGERVGLIGENGAGKSTLLAVLAGERIPDRGTVTRRSPVAMIHQSQDAHIDDDARRASEFRAPAQRAGLSGGELTRRRIAAALSMDAPLLLADEPTTDLDAEGAALLARRLAERRGALVLVSHDRSLLDALCSRILCLEDGHIDDFPGGYEAYRAERSQRRERQQFEYDQYRGEAERLKAAARKKTEWAQSVRKAPKRMGNSEARLHTHEYTNAVLKQSHARRVLENRLDRLEVKERPRDLPDIRMTLGASTPVGAKQILEARIKRMSAGSKPLLADARLALPTGSRTALIGPNGCGKTTLLRILRGADATGVHFSGSVRLNPAAHLAWFDQDHGRSLSLDRTALENVRMGSPAPEADSRTVLARLGLPGDQVFKPTSVLSGGERAKVALAKILLSEANLLILDEPTNHLDVFALEALEQLLKGYGGTVLFVSHDRAFTESTATRCVRFEGGSLTTFEGTPAQWEAEQQRDRAAEALQLEVSALEMRLAALAARMAAPRKGDRPDALSREYDDIAAQLRALKRR